MDVLNIFDFFCLGRGKGESEASGQGGGSIFIENPRAGVLQAEGLGPGGSLRRIGEFGGGGYRYFFSRGRNVLDERQITHLICARLNYDLYMTFSGGVSLGLFIQEKKNRKQAQNTP